MKTFLGILSLLSLLSFSVACDRGIQREEAMEDVEMREDTENYNRALPVEEEEGLIEREEEELIED